MKCSVTEKGLQNLAEIGDLIVGYMRMLQQNEVSERIWKEMKIVSDMGFTFRSKADAMSTVTSIVRTLKEDFPPEEALCAPSVLYDFDAEAIRECLSVFKPENMQVGIVGKEFEEKCTETEKWYGTKYKKEPIPAELMSRWSGDLDPAALGLALPKPNPFLPEDLSIKNPSGVEEKQPRLLAAENRHLYFLQDTIFKLPKAIMAFNFHCPWIVGGSREENLHRSLLGTIWASALLEDMSEWSYEAEMAGLEYRLSMGDKGISLTVSGYNDKMREVAGMIGQKMREGAVTERSLGLVLEKLERQYRNGAKTRDAYRQAMELSNRLLAYNSFTAIERLEGFLKVKEMGQGAVNEAILAASKSMFADCFLEGLVMGNLNESEAAPIADELVSKLELKRSFDQVPAQGAYRLPRDGAPMNIAVEHSNPDDKNNAVTLFLGTEKR